MDPLLSGQTSDPTPTTSPLPTSLLPRYELLDKLGQGGMGIVYKARDSRLDRTVVLKFLPPHMSSDDTAKKRFLVEAQAAAALEHPNICTIHEIGEASDGQLYIVMAYYDGETLSQRLARGPLPPRDAVSAAIEILRGLSKAHDRSIVHRDIKPANVIITKDDVVKILDFGIAKLTSNALTQTGGVIGTFAYMSPEQAFGEAVDARSDIWSVGVVLYEMLTGTNPFRRETPQATMYAVITANVDPISAPGNGVPSSLDLVLKRALTREKPLRFATAQELIGELKSVLNELSATPAAPVRRLADTGMSVDSTLTRTGERRQTTVVSSHIHRYSDMVERVSPEHVEKINTAIREAAVEISGQHGGILNHFDGEEMTVLFGVPVAHEDDFVRAARFAIAMHKRMDVIAAGAESELSFKLQLRTGLHTGVVVAQRLRGGDRRFKIAGPPLTIANRLAGIARAGQIITSPEAERLISPFFLTEALAPVSLRGDAPPSIPYRITGESGAGSRLEAAQVSGLTRYIGRERELADLQEQLQLARSGNGQLAIVVGDAGVGKSRLLFEFQQGIRDNSMRMLRGRADAVRLTSPYLPFTQALEDALGITREGRTADALHDTVVSGIMGIGSSLEKYLPFLLHLLSIPSTTFPLPKHLQKEEFHSAMADALVGVLTLEAARAPILLALEDWHWADDASRQVLRQLSEITPGFALLIVVTSRPDQSRDLGSGEHCRVIHLGPVDANASYDLLRAVLDVERVSDDIAREVLRRADGNPFFIEEMCRALMEAGALDRKSGQAVVTDRTGLAQLPDTVQAVIGTRIDRLESAARDVLKIASVIGTDFRRITLDAVVEKSTDVSKALDLLKSAGLIQQFAVIPHAAYRFRHVLTHEVAYGSLLEHQRAALHSSVGHAIEKSEPERVDEQADVLVRHFSCAREWRPAIEYSLLASDRAARLNQFTQALAILDAAHGWLVHLHDDSSRDELLADLLFRQERTCETLGLRERQHQLVDSLIELLEPKGKSQKLADAYLRQGELYTLLRQFYLAAQALEKSLKIARDGADILGERNALRSLGFMRWQEGDFNEALVLVHAALEIDRPRGDQEAVEGDLTNLGQIYKGAGDYDRALECLEEASRLSVERGDKARHCYLLGVIGQVHSSRGDLETALDYLERADELARAEGLHMMRAFLLTTLAHAQLQIGRVDESIASYNGAIEVSRRTGYTSGHAQALRILGDLLLTLKRDAEAVDRLTEASRLFRQLEDPETEGEVLSRLAPALERLGRWSEALAAWESARALPRSTGGLLAELHAVEGIARASRAEGLAQATVIERYEEALALSVASGDRDRMGALLNTLGILEFEREGFDKASHHYREAAALFHDTGDKVHEGLMLNSLGVMLLKLSRDGEAEKVLNEARDLNSATGQRMLLAHSLSGLADVAERAGDLDSARSAYHDSLDIRRALGDKRGEGWSLIKLARVERLAGETATAVSLEKEALSIAGQVGDSALEAEAASSNHHNVTEGE